jgi:serine/threonine protein kinase
MVVMDQIDGEHMFGSKFTPEDLVRVQEAKDLLHRHNLVFGDLRPSNILKPADGSGVMLVDFDWCALAGEGEYPLTMNSDPSCSWHPEVGPGVVMRKEHDDHLYASLRCSSV